VTVKFSAPATASDIRTLEYGGIKLASFSSTASSGDSAWSRSGNFTLPTVPILLVAANMVATSTAGPTGSFTQRLLTKPYGDSAEDRVVTILTAAYSYNAGARLTLPGPWLMEMVILEGD
jgi:hypothetical protein